ncbi:ubiquitin family protein [Thermotoga caldifontis]|uniref:sulfur transfer protein involved in thiamine biosynthesis n=1 Tax=Thermotoga caldifontis TaxID=1508419 RepID=UPI0005972DA6|nr:sulfur transfer protein involved in thiamine biosynthesis [Thermotoga caldifontis]
MDNRRIVVVYQGRTFEFEKPMTVKQLLSELRLNPLEHLVQVDGKLYTEDRTIRCGSQVVIHRVTSAG